MTVTNGVSDGPVGRVFYGWWVVAAVFVAEMFAIGSTSYAFSLFVVPVGEALDLSRAATNSGLALILLGMALSAPVVGRLLDRVPARYILVGGALAMGSGLAGLGLAGSPWLMAVLLLLLVGPGASAMGPLTAATVVSRWFHERRGRALGVAAVATSLGGTVLVPLIGLNLAWFGWRGALLIQGGAIAVLVSLVAMALVRDRPGDLGLRPDGASADVEAGAGSASDRAWRAGEILAHRDFWCIALAVGLTFAVNQAVLASLVPYALDIGISATRASLLVSLLSFASILGKLGFGAIADRVDKRWILFVIMALILLQLAVLWAQPALLVLVLVLAVGGLATGGELPVWQALVADRFGRVSYGTALGFMQFILTLCSLVSIVYVGRAYDIGGNYETAFVAFMAVVGVAMALVLLISSTPGRQR